MGLGDELMAVGEALMLKAKSVRIGRSLERPCSSPVFENLPWLSQSGEPPLGTVLLKNHAGARSYIDYGRSDGDHQAHVQAHRPQRGIINLTDDEEAYAADHIREGSIILEPHVKRAFSGDNKIWPWEHWREVAWLLLQVRRKVYQVSDPHRFIDIPFAERVKPPSARHALACISRASVVVCSEGLFHHAAAAFNVPAVVLWGARSNPLILGYPEQTNITSGTDYCGSITKCKHCKDAMLRIQPTEVLEAIKAAL